jgi:hypothetical protein
VIGTADAQGGQSGNQSASQNDPFNSLMISDRDRMEAALDRIAQEYRRVAGDKTRLSVGFPNIPNNSDYIRVTRHDLPVLAEPNFGAQNLTILGLAQVGEYLPVLQEVESTYTLNNPLSNTPNNGGKWCQVRISSGESGWVMVEPYGMGSTSFAQIVRRPQPQPAGNGNQDYGALVGLIIVVGVIVLFIKLTRSGGSGSGSSYSGGGGTYSSESSDEYESLERKEMDNLAQLSTKAGTVYEKTGTFSKDEVGSVDKEGKIYRKTGTFSKEEVGSIDKEGKIYKKTGMFSKEEIGSVDNEGRIYKKTGTFSKEEVGSVDKEGTIYKKTGMFNKEEIGRIEKKK